ncbi:hypothetical protein [Fimbriiglobus ruber]|uniref:Uncharacterized protein n=1 Tax=Fimbriiglobus ruber TaxID=1908690 RepID=A0A225DKM4_9BACT|nr:hypothetical protein [Fimbriiglobus ruber]OWK41991.1 hypothetical protein FRUB_04069 [Fimbriiglobus ruber]
MIDRKRAETIQGLLDRIISEFGGNGVATLVIRDLDDPNRGIIFTTDDFDAVYAFMRAKGFRQ